MPDTSSRETMIADISRRHPAAADDVDAILAMPVNEGLLEASAAQHFNLSKGQPAQFVRNGVLETCQCRECAALRAVPSPDTVGVREALEMARRYAEYISDDMPLEVLAPQASQLGDALLVLASLSPSHCTAGRREEMLTLADEYEAGTKKAAATGYEEFGADFQHKRQLIIDALRLAALTSEQSGPTAGREEVVGRITKMICEKLCGEEICTDDGNWMCPASPETVNEWCKELAEKALALTEQKAGRETCSTCRGSGYSNHPDSGEVCQTCGGCGEALTPSPPDRQQDQDETSVVFSQCEQCWQPATCKKYGCRTETPSAEPVASKKHDPEAKAASDFLVSKSEEMIKFTGEPQDETSVLSRVNLSGTDFLPMDQVRAIDAARTPSPPVSDASREALEGALHCLEKHRAIDPAIKIIRAALNNSLDKTGGVE